MTVGDAILGGESEDDPAELGDGYLYMRAVLL